MSGSDHNHEHDHEHPDGSRFSEVELRVKALESLLVDKGVVDPAATRLPRYARGRPGVIVRDHGVFIFPDANAAGLGRKPQHLYSVRFAARDLWGETAPAHDAVYLDLWDDYLEPMASA